MENLKVILKKNGWASIIESIIFAILGIILVYKPEGTVKIITSILGTIFIVMGIAKIIKYFTTKGNNDFFNYELVYGLTSIVIGIEVEDIDELKYRLFDTDYYLSTL